MLASLLVASLAFAAPAQKARTLPELIDLAMREGKEAPLNADMAAELGLGEREIPGRTLQYKQSHSPDKLAHAFEVLLESGKPTALVVAVYKATTADGQTSVDGTIYLASLKGKLRSACRNQGPVGDIRASKIEITSAVRKRFRVELDYFRKLAPSLSLEFVR